MRVLYSSFTGPYNGLASERRKNMKRTAVFWVLVALVLVISLNGCRKHASVAGTDAQAIAQNLGVVLLPRYTEFTVSDVNHYDY